MANLQFGVDLILSNNGLRKTSSAVESSLSEASKRWLRNVQEETADAIETGVKAALRSNQTEQEWKKFTEGPVASTHRYLTRLIATGRTAEAAAIQEQFRIQIRQQKQLIEQRESALEDSRKMQMRSVDEQVDAFKTGLQGIGQTILGGNLEGLVDILKGGGQRISQAGLARQQRAKELETKDPTQATNLAKMGMQLGKIGSSLVVFAAVAGSLVMLVKLFMDLETKAKDMNKALLDTAGAADFGMSAAEIRGGGLAKTLETLRDETTAVNDNFMKFRASAKEQQEILNQFNQAGITFGKMKMQIDQGSEAMKSFSDVTALALTYAKTLGISTSEATQQMGQFSLETGMGLQDIAEQFSVITREAMTAGLSTKRFFQAVSEAASGMVFYGTRIEETTRLLSSFDTLLGESVGTEAFKELIGRYQDKGMQDRIRELIVKDQEFTQEQFSNAYQRTLQGIVRDFGGELDKQGVNVEQLLKSVGSEVELRRQLADLGVQGARQQQFLSAYRLRGAVEGGPGATAAGMAAMPYAGPGFDIAMALRSALPLEDFGASLGEVYDTALQTNNQALLVALEQLSESSGKSLDHLIALDNQGRATYERLSQVRDGVVDTMPKDLEKMGFFIDKQTGEIRKGYFDATNTLVKDNAVAIKNSFDVLTNTPTEGEDTMLEALTRDQEIAAEIARNTSTVSDVLEQTIAGILNNIYGVVEVIADFLADDRVKQQKLEAQHEAKIRRDELAAQARASEEQVQALSKKMEEALKKGDPNLVKSLEEQIDAAKENAALAEMALSRQEVVANAVNNLTDDMVTKEGAGAEAIINAIQRQGDKVFESEEMKKSFVQALDQALPRLAESQESGWAYFSEEFSKNWASLGGDPKSWAEEARKNLYDPKMLKRIAGGSKTVDLALEKGIEAAARAKEETGFFATKAEEQRNMAEAFSTAVSTAIAQQVQGVGHEEKTQNHEMIDLLRDLSEKQGVSGFDVARMLMGQARTARDVIIPSGGGPPIITDSKDTVMAMKPGGAIDRATRGGAPSNVTIHIYPQSSQDMYNQVIRIVKTLESR